MFINQLTMICVVLIIIELSYLLIILSSMKHVHLNLENPIRKMWGPCNYLFKFNLNSKLHSTFVGWLVDWLIFSVILCLTLLVGPNKKIKEEINQSTTKSEWNFELKFPNRMKCYCCVNNDITQSLCISEFLLC